MEVNKYLGGTYAAETKEFRDNGGIVLSPSGISKFFNEPNEWYLDRIGATTFDGNSHTVLGNAIHGAIDAYWDGEEVTEDDVVEWMNARYQEQMDTIDDKGFAKVDPEFVAANFMNMFIAWKAGYADMYPKPDMREYALSIDIQEGMRMAGTIDGYEDDRSVVIDYKTCGRKPSGISESHRLQLSAYAFMMIAKGYEVDTIRVVYIQRPTKTLPARIWVFDEELEDKQLLVMTDTIEMMKGSWNAAIEHPELTKYLFRPNRVAKF